MELILTILVGFAGGLTAMRFKVPAGAMVGSMIATAFFNVITGKAFMPADVKIITQIAAGAFVGAGISREDILGLRYIVKPAAIMVVSMLLLNLLMGFVMYKATGIDLVTCLFASAPAGIVDMSLISSDMGADTSKVAVLQMVRLLIVFIVLPPMMKFIHSKVYLNDEAIMAKEEVVSTKIGEKQKEGLKEKAVNLALTLGVALVLGFIGYKIKVPAGTMSFAMLAVGAINVFTGRGYMPLNLRRATQVFAGILIGSRMTSADIIALRSVLVPAIILIAGIIILNLLIGFIISKTSNMEIVTALLASAPGGVSDMALIAKDLGGDAPKVAIMQLSRYVGIIALFPVIIKYVSSLL